MIYLRPAKVLKCDNLLDALLALFNSVLQLVSSQPIGNKALSIPFLNRQRLTLGPFILSRYYTYIVGV